ncbi:hypothetical protein D9M69_686360 [compost metagenome]
MGQRGENHMVRYGEAQHVLAVGQHFASLVQPVGLVEHRGHHHRPGTGAYRAPAVHLLRFRELRLGDAPGLHDAPFDQRHGSQAYAADQGHFLVAVAQRPSAR